MVINVELLVVLCNWHPGVFGSSTVVTALCSVFDFVQLVVFVQQLISDLDVCSVWLKSKLAYS